mmetsp:Transcript_14246/g.36076  ORF Transcript_14246/g.36076 Transcript_14246/m.36076 type:complete len:207 (-) Transcript_14246:975-1595(-)
MSGVRMRVCGIGDACVSRFRGARLRLLCSSYSTKRPASRKRGAAMCRSRPWAEVRQRGRSLYGYAMRKRNMEIHHSKSSASLVDVFARPTRVGLRHGRTDGKPNFAGVRRRLGPFRLVGFSGRNSHRQDTRKDVTRAVRPFREGRAVLRHSLHLFGIKINPASVRRVRKSASSRGAFYDSYLVDPASSHMLVSKIKPCMSKYSTIL